MKKIVIAFLLGLSLNTAWSKNTEKSGKAQVTSERTEADAKRFSELVKSTLELMGPTLEVSQTETQQTENSK